MYGIEFKSLCYVTQINTCTAFNVLWTLSRKYVLWSWRRPLTTGSKPYNCSKCCLGPYS